MTKTSKGAYFKYAALFIAIALISFTLPARKTKIHLIGDSTMSDKRIAAYPENGWGMTFSKFFDTTTTVVINHAQNGRSTRTFMQENRWAPVVEDLAEGDIVLIQFGHNDEVKTKAASTTEKEFQANLTKYVKDTKSKKAIPVLITPVARRSFDSTGKVVDTHRIYSELVRKLAKKQKVTLIDLDRKSQALIQSFGPENSKWLFNHLKPGQHPNHPEGKVDDTHFSELGARKVAEIVFGELQASNPGHIVDHFFKPAVKKN